MMKKMMLLIAVIQIAALSACGNAVSVTPVETDTAQTEQTKSVEEDITMAEEAVQAGACLVNDIWGCKYDDRMARVIARTGAACCLMHNRNEPVYENYLEDVKADLLRSVELARQAGVAEDKIILDPGMGFGKTYEHNLILMNRLEILNGLGYPVLLGTSRKSMIGLTLDLPATDRVEGTLVTTVMGVMKGCAFVRVHDVKENARAIRMTEAILQA